MKISEYPTIKVLNEETMMLVDDATSGTRIISMKDAIFAALDLNGVENHRMLFRGKNLGATVTSEQIQAIKAGTFKDIWLGDYWEINGVKWRVADFDYWYNTGNPNFTNHHVVIIPDTNLYTANMNDTAITTNGYVGSKMYTANLAQAKSAINTAFGSYVLTHKEYLINAVADGVPSAGAWYDSTVDLMNEIMVYGTPIETSSGSAVKTYTIDKQQIALFAASTKFVNTGGAYWLRDIVSASQFANVDHYGSAASANANTAYGVRPVFPIG